MVLTESVFEERVRAEKVEALARNLRLSNILGAVVATLMTLTVAPKAQHLAWLWLCVYLAMTVGRELIMYRFRRRTWTAAELGGWGHRLAAMLFFSGSLWGAFGFLTFDPADAAHTLFIATVQTGLGAQALASLSMYRPAMLCFCMPILTGFIVPRVMTHNSEQLTISGMAIMFVGIMIYAARNSERDITQSIRLRYNNQQLIEDLRESNDKAEAASRAKSEFLAVMSHEIRTPMNGIGAMAELLSSTPLGDEQQGMVSIIRQSAEGLLSILGDILDYSKIEAGRLSLEQTAFDLPSLAENVLQILALTAEEKRLALVLDIAADVPPEIRGDPARLRQILFNLLSNAVKFTEAGHVLLRVKRRAEELSFWVSDTGSGIPPEVQQKLFMPFMQADSSVARRFGGTGLGLSICKRLVELMNGQISLTSTPGLGTTVQFSIPLVSDVVMSPGTALLGKRLAVQARFPLKEAVVHMVTAQGATICESVDDADLVVWEDHAPPPGKPAVELIAFRYHIGDWTSGAVVQKPVRARELVATILQQLDGISDNAPPAAGLPAAADSPGRAQAEARRLILLVVEDHPINRLVISKLLDRMGLLYDIAEDGVEALEQFTHHAYYGLVLTDIHMPRMDGFALAEAIRRKGAATLPIVALTADAMPETLQRCDAAGFNAHLTKPLSLAALQESIARWLPGAMRREPERPPALTVTAISS